MNSSAIFKLIRMWGLGGALFLLRFLQNTRDFDPSTGLHTISPVGIILTALIPAAILLAFLCTRRDGRDRPSFAQRFSAPGVSVILLIAGSFLLGGGGALLLLDTMKAHAQAPAFTVEEIALLAVGGLAVLSCFFLLLLIRQMRRGSGCNLVLVLPPMFFAAFWVLALYLPAANDPVLARYCLPVVAAAAAAYAFAQLAGFFRGETKARHFSFLAECAVILCVGAAAQMNVHSLLYAGCALILCTFAILPKHS